MAKPSTPLTIKWELRGDGMRPIEAPFGYIVRNPLILVIPPGKTALLASRVACNHPLQAWPTRTHATYLKVPPVIQPGEEIIVELTNTSAHVPMIIESKEALVHVCPIAPPPGTVAEVG